MARNYHAKNQTAGKKRQAPWPNESENNEKKSRKKPRKKPPPPTSSSSSESSDSDDELLLHVQNGSGLSTAVKATNKKYSRGDRHLRSRHLWPEDKRSPAWIPKPIKPMSISEEIYLFAKYMRLQQIEMNARKKLTKCIKTVIEKHMAPTLVTFEAFGSFAAEAEPRATFRSDIDLSIEKKLFEGEKQEENDDCESTDNSSTYEDEKDPIYSTGMSFNFEAPTAVNVDSILPDAQELDKPITMSRNQQARLLARVSKGLRQCKDFRIHVIGKAKVPIVNLVHTISQLEVDISVGVDKTNVSDQVIAYYSSTYRVFNPVIVLLKEFLHQSALNKPFNGGIGSYRLYVMVGHIINLVDEPSNAWRVLNLFFEFFASPGRFNSNTILRIQIPRTNLRCEAEFKHIHRIGECNSLFQLAMVALRKTIQQPKRGPSILSAIFCCPDIREDRIESLNRAKALLMVKTSQLKDQPKPKKNTIRNGKQRPTTSSKKLNKLKKKNAKMSKLCLPPSIVISNEE
ncbi:hypothetical protein THRCLA_06873 [Thraustotheca clavata]|uniref:Poly(A) RNA polymerase mitochondrial-like central palm domain-containing protein n=1 Tax=Thraustotheca clavata TaxID=74557 RepID=A0A1V9ZIE5_9STRA|nr:hypothetical protein THRCLA_06873 [Thraustotheca clavata]